MYLQQKTAKQKENSQLKTKQHISIRKISHLNLKLHEPHTYTFWQQI